MPNTPKCLCATFEGHEGLYVLISHCGIHPLVIACDGLPLMMHGRCGRQKAYIKVSDAIAWHEKELAESHGLSGRPDAVQALKALLARFEAIENKEAETFVL